MKFRKLTVENYKSFQFPTEILFPVGEDGRSIFLIGGMNGAGKTSIMEAVTYCLYGGKVDEMYRNINRREKAKGNANVTFELVMEMDDGSELVVKRSWTAGAASDPRRKDLTERLVVVRDGKRVSVQSKEIWQDFIRAVIPPGITQFFFFDGEKIQEIAADDHSEVRLKSSLEAAFQTEPESREAMREQEKKRILASNRLAQVESEIRDLCEKALPFSIAGKLFEGIRRRIEAERESASGEAIRENAAALAKRIVRAVEEPEPIYREKLSAERMAELERRIVRLLQDGDPGASVEKILDLSDRDAARVLNRMESLETSDVFLLKPLLEEARGLEVQIRQLEGIGQSGGLTQGERELFDELQAEMEGCSTQIGRKTEQLRLVEEDILVIERRIGEIEVEIEKLYQKHDVSKEKADFIEECDNIVNNYFPNAGEQVVILSTDTEIDTFYYRTLKSRLSGAAILEFDQRQELTTFRQGYFWEHDNG